jgi:2-keto-4-pentenoate hydratase/2-oxohepta-3-ene-1,7-dioic acid hydratase in catechol pathway
MHLVTFLEIDSNDDKRSRIGLLDRDHREVVDLSQCGSHLPSNMQGLLNLGEAAFPAMKQALSQNIGRLSVDTVKFLAPVPRPLRNILCVGKNYPDHVKEVQSVVASKSDNKGEAPAQPIFFTKATTSVIGPNEPIPAWLDETESVDYEGELAVVIGQGGRGISADAAMQHVYGYTIVNDVTSRRLQKQHQQWFLGKSLDGFCPMGPSLVTRDEIPDVTKLRVQTHVNDELRQNGVVGEMLFDIPTLIATLSKSMTLQTGDIIATGTPAGVGMGFRPPRFLKNGDRVSIAIEPIGTLENPVE